jgi:hypothetical protein
MRSATEGFSLVEVIAALTISLGVGIAVFHLFHQNEEVFRDQNLTIEMQQGARVVASQIADEVRMAGEGVPIYASMFDNGDTESVAAILATSTNDRIDFRTASSDSEGRVTNGTPLELVLDAQAVLAVGNGSDFSDTLGTSNPTGRFVYIWGPVNHSLWTWARAELVNITPTALTVIPRQAGDAGRAGNLIRFSRPPTVSLEEAVSFFISGGAIKRATATAMTDPTNPTWSAANDVGRNFTSLAFIYYDKNNNHVTPASLSERVSIARIDVRVTAQTAAAMTNGFRQTFPLSLRIIPRNMRVR